MFICSINTLVRPCIVQTVHWPSIKIKFINTVELLTIKWKKQTHHIARSSHTAECVVSSAVFVPGESEERPWDYWLWHKRQAWPLLAQNSNGSGTVVYTVEEKGIECDILHSTIQSLTSPAYMDNGVELMHNSKVV